MRGLPFDLRFERRRPARAPVHGSPRKVNEYLFEDKPASRLRAARRRRGLRRPGLRPHAQAVDPRVRRRAVRQLRLGRQAEGRRPTRRLRDPRGRRGEARRGAIERVAYDADGRRPEVERCRPAGRVRRRSWWPLHERFGGEAMKYVLFVCTHNAGRSQMAQAFFERHAPEDVRAESAGSDPATARLARGRRGDARGRDRPLRPQAQDGSGPRCSCMPTGR